jgi:hypothetical protein
VSGINRGQVRTGFTHAFIAIIDEILAPLEAVVTHLYFFSTEVHRALQCFFVYGDAVGLVDFSGLFEEKSLGAGVVVVQILDSAKVYIEALDGFHADAPILHSTPQREAYGII